MSESKFTPGEWTACFAHDGKGTIFSWHVTGAKHGSTHPICGLRSVSPEMRSSEEDRANARLIAAAPELYGQHEANIVDLQMLRRAIEEGDHANELLIRVDDLLKFSRAALLKATPEQSDV